MRLYMDLVVKGYTDRTNNITTESKPNVDALDGQLQAPQVTRYDRSKCTITRKDMGN